MEEISVTVVSNDRAMHANRVNRANLSQEALLRQGVDVTAEDVHLGMRVRRGRDWNNKKWRDDRRMGGTILGFTDASGVLVGENTGRKYPTDRITAENGPAWAVVMWDTGVRSTYPIGAGGLYSLLKE